MTARGEQQAAEFKIFVEERTFLREWGLTDREIAERLGIKWETYLHRFLRHPELDPIYDPEDRARKEQTKWTVIARGRRRRVAR